jgi:protein-S-isoprenylcysteine O-methyltransferase Ste14
MDRAYLPQRCAGHLVPAAETADGAARYCSFRAFTSCGALLFSSSNPPLREELVPHLTEEVVCVLSVLGVYAARIVELRKRRDTIAGAVRENVTLRVFVLTGTLMGVGSIAEFLLVAPPFRPAVFASAWGLAVASFALRRAAIRALGRFWSLHVEIRREHELVLSGPYRWMRHPTYLSMVLELASFGLFTQAVWSSAAALLVFVPTVVWRIRIEEEALIQKFGRAYGEYQRTTPALFPLRLGGAS